MGERLWRDLRYACRGLSHAPGFSAAVVLTLALGVGSSAAVFSGVYGMLIRPLPYRDAERLVVIRLERSLEGVQRPVRSFFPLADLTDFQAGTHAFESIAFYSSEPVVLSRNGFTEPLTTASVSDGFFETVRGRIRAGRGLSSGDGDRSAIVISERLQQRLFGENSAIGQRLRLGSRSYEIAGVADRTFQFPTSNTDAWLPAVGSGCCPYAAVARLKPAVGQPAALADVGALLPVLAAKSPRVYAGAGAVVAGLRDELVGDQRTVLWVLFASVGLLLAVSCANALTLLVGRNAARSRETAVRIAVGASRSRLCLESSAEAVLIVAAAALTGMLVAAGLRAALLWLDPAGLPGLDAEAIRIDRPVFAFALTIAAAIVAVMGLLPAVAPDSVIGVVKSGTPGVTASPGRRRLHRGLVVAQLAIAVVLLVSASLLGRSLVRLMKTDVGVRTDHIATAAINLSYERKLNDAQQRALLDAILARIASLPNVQAVGAGAGLPPHGSTIRLTLKRFGDTVDYEATAVPATPGYFSTLGVRLLKGRLFTDADGESQQQVMIMTADTARRFFAVDDPVGRTMTMPVLRDGVPGSLEVTLVGVIGNVKYSGLQAAPDDSVYRPLRQQGWPVLFLVARTSGDPDALASILKREIATVDPAVTVSSATTLDSIIGLEAAQPRFRSALLAVLAVVTLGIAAVGLYGVIAHSVSARTNEFGVRMALGAGMRHLLSLVFLEGAKLAAGGVVLGVVGSLAATRILARLLYAVEPTDGMSFGIGCGVLLLVAAVATYIPARRASRLNPILALRSE